MGLSLQARSREVVAAVEVAALVVEIKRHFGSKYASFEQGGWHQGKRHGVAQVRVRPPLPSRHGKACGGWVRFGHVGEVGKGLPERVGSAPMGW